MVSNKFYIFKITNLNNTEAYVGTTTRFRSLKALESQLKEVYQNYKDGKHLYKFRFYEILDDANYKIKLLERCTTNDEKEVLEIENEWYSLTQECINNEHHDFPYLCYAKNTY